MKVRFNRWYNAVLSALLGLLGFESCDSPEEYGSIPVEYGTPHADYIVKGVVSDEAGNPVQGIQANFMYDMNFGVISASTDASGNYEINARAFPEFHDCQLVVEDIDGEANGGEFLSDTLDLSTKKPVQVKKGSGAWYDGTYELSQDIKLKKK